MQLGPSRIRSSWPTRRPAGSRPPRVAEELRIREHGCVPTLVLFDLDGTVLDGSGLPDAMRATCRALAAGLAGVTADALATANDAVWKRIWPEVEDDYMLGGRRGADVSREAWRLTLADCGVHDARVLDRAVQEWDREERASLRLFPDALPAIAALEAGGARIGMVTNGAATVQRDKLDAVGLSGRFDPLVISSDAGFTKPDPRIFEVALSAAGVPAAETWFVGDNRWHDLPGARQTGIRTYWLDRHGAGLQGDGPQPDAVIASLAELV
jgi:putative hydrolase of the HAD superfamily